MPGKKVIYFSIMCHITQTQVKISAAALRLAGLLLRGRAR